MRTMLAGVGLVGAWCALWGSASAANILSGTLLVGVILSFGFGASPTAGTVRIGPLLKFVGLVAADLVLSTVNVAKEVLTPVDSTDESVVAVRLPDHSRRHLLMLVIAVTVTPGTAVVDTDADEGTLYLHLLHHDRRAATVAHVEELARLAEAALPGPKAVAS